MRFSVSVIAAALLAALILSACGGGDGKSVGAALYQKQCQSCHGGASGGSIQDIPPRHNANGHTWHHPDQQLRQIIVEGSAIPGR